MPELRTIAEGLRFPEGPVALADGSVLVVEIRRGTLSRVAPDGAISVVADCGGGPNGAAIGPDGAVYVCDNGGFRWHDRDGLSVPGGQPDDYSGGRLQRVTLDGEVTDVRTEVDGRPLRGPNDLVFDADGGCYFTDFGKTRAREMDLGGLYYALPDGSRGGGTGVPAAPAERRRPVPGRRSGARRRNRVGPGVELGGAGTGPGAPRC